LQSLEILVDVGGAVDAERAEVLLLAVLQDLRRRDNGNEAKHGDVTHARSVLRLQIRSFPAEP